MRETDLDEIGSGRAGADFDAEERASVLHLTEHTCKWPIGDPGTTDFHFLRARTKSGSPYCATHAAMAYQPLRGAAANPVTSKSSFQISLKLALFVIKSPYGAFLLAPLGNTVAQ